MRILVIDTEATGVSPKIDEFVSIAMLAGDWDVEGHEVKWGQMTSFHRKPSEGVLWGNWPEIYVKPRFETEGPRISWQEVVYLVSEAELLVGFNVKFDVDMLRSTAAADGVALPERNMLCVQRDILPDVDQGRLSEVHARWTAREPREWHSAAEDVWATAHIFEARLFAAAAALEAPVYDVRVFPKTEIQKAIVHKLGFRWDWNLRCTRRNYTGAQIPAGDVHREILIREKIPFTTNKTQFHARPL